LKQRKSQPYRLGLDLGSSSIGWCIYDLDVNKHQPAPSHIRCLGVRIFNNSRDPVKKQSLAVSRRLARQRRRRRDRFIRRKALLFKRLVRFGLYPSSPAEQLTLANLDPYICRARAVEGPVSSYELGRALYHLSQRRGFKSSRKRQDDADGRSLSAELDALELALKESGAKSLGQFFARRREQGLSTRARPDVGLYPRRKLYKAEFDLIRETQAKFHPTLNEENWDLLEHTIFFQRPLEAQKPGKCLLIENESRAARALPSFQRLRLLQQISDMKFQGEDYRYRNFDTAQKVKLAAYLEVHKELKFTAIHKLLGLPADTHFNLSSERRTKLNGNSTACFLRKKSTLGKTYDTLTLSEQDKLVEILSSEDDTEQLQKLLSENYSFSAEEVTRLIGNEVSIDDFESGYCSFSIKALNMILPHIGEPLFLGYSEAVKSAGFHHSNFRPDNLKDRLPYYGEVLRQSTIPVKSLTANKEEKRFGRIPNPTVHVGLNQVRKVVNTIIELHGLPKQIVVEIARDIPLGAEGITKLERQQVANQKDNQRIIAEIKTLIPGIVKVSSDDIQKYKLWEELGGTNLHRCLYSGRLISAAQLFNGDVEVEHILPFAETHDDSIGNKTIAFKQDNNKKGERSPYQAFRDEKGDYAYEKIFARVEQADKLPANKRWRFMADAMDRYLETEDFAARELNDTRYIARAAARYLQEVCSDVWTVKGWTTALLRRTWGLKKLKKRNDHRHHALDAAILGLVERSLIQKISKVFKDGSYSLKTPLPWPSFVEELKGRLNTLTVSIKPNHEKNRLIFKDYAYGTINQENGDSRESAHNLVARKSLLALSPKEAKEQIRSAALSSLVSNKLGQDEAKDISEILAEVSELTGAKRARILKKNQYAVQITHPSNSPRHKKALIPDENVWLDVWKLPSGDLQVIPIDTFRAAQYNANNYRPHPAAKRVWKIFKGDPVRFIDNGIEKIGRVETLAPSEGNEKIVVVDNYTATSSATASESKIMKKYFIKFSQFKKKQFRKLRVDVLGRVADPGPLP